MINHTVLVIDDSSDIRTILRRLLVAEGFEVVEASDGYEAICRVRKLQPALIVLDLGLPGLHGFDVASQLRCEPALEDVPILAITAYATHPVFSAARRAGCTDVIGKPFQIDQITRRVNQLVHINQC